MKIIRAIILTLPVAALNPLLWEVLDYLTKQESSEIIIGIFYYLVLAVPIAIIAIYGYKTGDTTTAMLTGAIIVPIGFFFSLPFSFTAKSTYEIMVTFSILSMVIGSLEGYFSSKRRLKTTIILGIVWVLLIFPSFPISFIIF